MLGHFNDDAINNAAQVPICAEYCDAWFEACQDASTCITNWVDDLEYAEDITASLANFCPNGSICRTFREVYENGEGLCNEMFGPTYKYSTDADNCTVMAFNNSLPNPNLQLTFKSGTSTVAWSPAVMSGSALLVMYLLIKTTM